MRRTLLALIIVAVTMITVAWKAINNKPTANVKCMVQFTNYQGEGAYMIVSILDSTNSYLQALQVNGAEEEWYEDMHEWFRFYSKSYPDIDGITGGSIMSGGRQIFNLPIDTALFDTGHKLRFETAVEDQSYYSGDVEIVLNRDSLSQKIVGSGYIRYVKMLVQ